MKAHKYLLGLTFLSSVFCFNIDSKESDFLTYDYLSTNGYTDHVISFNILMSQIKINSFLEFGLGQGTKFFLDHCDEVTSAEILLPSQTDEWYNKCVQLYSDYTNWQPILYKGSRSLVKADNIAKNSGKDPAVKDGSYLLELKDFCDSLFAEKNYDVAFVDPGIHMRGDLVNELFDRVSIIVAHDTNGGDREYGWNKVQAPSNYVKIRFTMGQGTIFWVDRKRTDVIEVLKKANASNKSCTNFLNNNQVKENLRVFFPSVHPSLSSSMAHSLKHLGHTLVLPGDSFRRIGSNSKPILSSTFNAADFLNDYPELNGSVEVIEYEELFFHPPDVLFVNCNEVEESILKIFSLIRKNTPVKLAHYSGNNCTYYNRKFLKNLLVVDACTAGLYINEDVTIAPWIPWIDYDRLSYEGTNDDLVISSFLGLHYKHPGFANGSKIFQNYTESYTVQSPNLHFLNYEGLSPNEIASALESSSATLHIKDIEGFGFTIVESLAKGRPVFLKRSFSVDQRLMNWCIEGKTAFFFDTYDEFRNKMDRYLSDSDYRHEIQIESARTIRRLINNEKQARVLENFLQTLR